MQDAGIYHRRSSSAMSFGSLKSQVNSNFSADYKARATTKDGRSDHTDLERRRLRKVLRMQQHKHDQQLQQHQQQNIPRYFEVCTKQLKRQNREKN